MDLAVSYALSYIGVKNPSWVRVEATCEEQSHRMGHGTTKLLEQ